MTSVAVTLAEWAAGLDPELEAAAWTWDNAADTLRRYLP